MKHLLLVVISSAVVNNVVLVRQVGLCPLLQGSGSLKRMLRLGLVITAVMTVGVMACGMLNTWVLGPLRLFSVMTLADALVILMLSRLAAWMAVRTGWFRSGLSKLEDMMFSAQCVALAVILMATAGQYPVGWPGLVFGAGSGLGWTMVAVVFETIRRRLDEAPVPSSMRGLPIYLVAFGLLALVGMGLAGVAGIE